MEMVDCDITCLCSVHKFNYKRIKVNYPGNKMKGIVYATDL